MGLRERAESMVRDAAERGHQDGVLELQVFEFERFKHPHRQVYNV
jgi:hypothetical protein